MTSTSTTRSTLVLAETPRCSVALGQLSYDDPDADDAEYIQLVVRGAAVADAGSAGAEATAGSTENETTASLNGADAGEPCGIQDPTGSSVRDATPSALTLGDCGLESLELLNGGTEGCPAYRSLSLATVPVPDDGLVLICSPSSTIASSAGCDVTHEGTRALPNSWFQNGPNDGLRFTTVSGRMEIAYEGALDACFEAEPWVLVTETGAASDGADDVNVACDGSFSLLSGVDPRQAPPCAASSPDAGAAGVGAGDAPVDAGSLSPTTNAVYGSIEQTFSAEPARILLPPLDAGSSAESESAVPPPSVGCSVTRPERARLTAEGIMAAVAMAASWIRIRVRRRPGSRSAPAHCQPPCGAQARRRAVRSGASPLR